ETELGNDKSLQILDIGCGTGRHAIEMTRRGYEVTGIDLSSAQLQQAGEKAALAGLSIKFQQMDACQMTFQNDFDMAIMICEGAFPLMETDEKNYAILAGAFRALRPGGKFIFTTLNGLFPLFHSVEEFSNRENDEGNVSYSKNTFDLMSFRDNNLTTFTDDEGNTKTLECNERYYVPSEITWLLKSLGFTDIGIYGARLGEFSRDHKLRTDDFEMLVVCKKPAQAAGLS
ncbi:MAG: class I SAM-dependent methyltransferase, partial [Candidatus Cloacimonadaceae bacterium]|nr:class I SAM-dependent methyltransferase [Candidatus Cloacimonadaceae bacterium]